MTRLYRPKAVLRLAVPLPDKAGGAKFYTFDVPVMRSRHERNDANTADSLEVTVDWLDSGVDPRWISGALCQFFLWDEENPPADDEELRAEFGLEPRSSNEPPNGALRFVGRMVKPARSMQSESLKVEMLFHDNTSFFLTTKPLATKGIPLYSENLAEAWTRICKEVPGAAALASAIELRGLTTFPVIGSAVAERFRKKGQLATKPNNDAWAIWQQCCGMMGLISFFDIDTLVVTTATDLYSLENPPRFIHGVNLLDFTEEKNTDRAVKGVGITSFDPISGRTIESLYNPLADNVKKLKPAAKHPKSKKPHTVDDSKEYDIFAYPGITDQSALDALAKRVYDERARHQVEGTLTTAEMVIEASDGQIFDLLSLRAGDAIDVRFLDDADAAFVKLFENEERRKRYLVEEMGYTEHVARIVAANVDSLTSRSSVFHVHSVTTELDGTDPDGGTFRISINYGNLIDIDPQGE